MANSSFRNNNRRLDKKSIKQIPHLLKFPRKELESKARIYGESGFSSASVLVSSDL